MGQDSRLSVVSTCLCVAPGGSRFLVQNVSRVACSERALRIEEATGALFIKVEF